MQLYPNCTQCTHLSGFFLPRHLKQATMPSVLPPMPYVSPLHLHSYALCLATTPSVLPPMPWPLHLWFFPLCYALCLTTTPSPLRPISCHYTFSSSPYVSYLATMPSILSPHALLFITASTPGAIPVCIILSMGTKIHGGLHSPLPKTKIELRSRAMYILSWKWLAEISRKIVFDQSLTFL